MKIKNLKLKNFTSYLGEHEINFDEIGKNNLFSISGQTGAGKSSILNAISLCLYGQSYKKSLNNADFVTQGKPKSEIEMSFIINNKRYKAKWSCKLRKKSGELLKRPLSNRKLYEEDELTDKTIEDILGLDYNQFCKTVILNQGEFSKFLLSTFSQRKEILEKIYQDNSLKQMQVVLRSEIQDQVNQLNAFEQSKKTLADNIDESTDYIKNINELDQKIKESKNTKIQLDINIKNTKDILNLLKQRVVDEGRVKTTQKEIALITNELNNTKILYKKLTTELKSKALEKENKFEQINHLEKLYQHYLQTASQIKNKEIKHNQSLQRCQTYQNEKLDLSKRKEDLDCHEYSKNFDYDSIEKQLSEMNDLENQAQQIRQQINKSTLSKNEINQKINETKEQKNDLIEKVQKTRQNINEYIIEKLTKEIIELKAHQEILLTQNKEIQTLIQTTFKKDFDIDRCRLEAQKKAERFIIETSIESAKELEQYLKNFINAFDTKSNLDKEKLISQKLNEISDQIQEKEQLKTKKEIEKQQLYTTEKNLEVIISRLDEYKNQKTKIDDDIQQLTNQEQHNQTKLNQVREALKSQLDIEEINSHKESHNIKNLRKRENLDKEILYIVKNIEREKIEQNELSLELKDLSTQLKQYLKQIPKDYIDDPSKFNNDKTKISKELETLSFKTDETLTQLRNNETKYSMLNGQLNQILENIQLTTDRLIIDFNVDIKDFTEIEMETYLQTCKLKFENLINEDVELDQQINFDQNMKTELETKAKEQDKLKIQIKEINDKIKLLKSSNEHKNNLYLLIGKDQFRNFVLDHIEKQLIFLANKELKNLYQARYQIVASEKQQDFFISDALSNNQKRKASTLSGGETFLVSLALALGLSELSRGNSRIDSFFIDEGFGTLDQDSLNDVVDVLHELKDRGKQIGIISHVESLNSRFNDRLILTKNQLGYSTVQHYH